mgnify:CR=1 FL=1
MKKKVLSAIVCAAMVFSMTACGLQSPNTGGNSGGTTNAASTSNAQHQMQQKQKQQLRQHPQGTAQQNRSDRRSHWFMQRLTR